MRVFEIDNHDAFFGMLLEQYDEYRKQENISSSRHAIICTLMAYHIREWILKSAYRSIVDLLLHIALIKNNDIENEKLIECKFNEYINEECPEIRIIREICNGSKHLMTNNKYLNDTYLNKGAFGPGFNGESFNTYDLIVLDSSGNRLLFKNVIEKVIDYWKSFYKANFPSSIHNK